VAAAALAVISVLVATAGSASALTAVTQDQPSSTWVQSGTSPLDGLAVNLAVNAPTPGPNQGSLFGYEYTLLFRFENRSGGLLVLGDQNGRKVVGFGLLTGGPITVVPFEWSLGRTYLLATYRTGTDEWAGYVFDYAVRSWTAIGRQTAPAGTGNITTTATTSVDYDATLAPTPADRSTCSFYPVVDAAFSAPIGFRESGRASVAKLGTNSVQKGDCPSTTSFVRAMQHYRLGTAA